MHDTYSIRVRSWIWSIPFSPGFQYLYVHTQHLRGNLGEVTAGPDEANLCVSTVTWPLSIAAMSPNFQLTFESKSGTEGTLYTFTGHASDKCGNSYMCPAGPSVAFLQYKYSYPRIKSIHQHLNSHRMKVNVLFSLYQLIQYKNVFSLIEITVFLHNKIWISNDKEI